MGITDSILEARRRGATDDKILSHIESQNPEKASVIDAARKRGADASVILNEFVRQNPVTSSAGPDGRTLVTRIRDTLGAITGSRLEQIGETFRQTASGQINPLETGLQSVGSVAGGIGEIAASALVGAGKALLPESVQTGIGKAVSSVSEAVRLPEVMTKYEDWKKLHPEAAKNLESAVNIASLFPVEKIAGTAAKAGAGIAGTAAKAAGTSVESVGRVAKSVGETAVQKALTPTVHEAERMLAYEAKTPFLTRAANVIMGAQDAARPTTRAVTAARKGIAGTERMVGVQAKREADNLWKGVIEPAVRASDAKISESDLFAFVDDRIAAAAEPGRRQALQDAYDAIKEDYAPLFHGPSSKYGPDSVSVSKPKTLSLETAQDIKRGLDEFTPEKVFRGKSVANEYATLKNDMANAIRQKTYEALKDQDIRRSYLDWGNLSELQKVGVTAISKQGLKAGSGKLLKSVIDLGVVPIATVGGQVLYRAGNALEFVGEKGFKTFGEFLKSKGFNLPELPKAKGRPAGPNAPEFLGKQESDIPISPSQTRVEFLGKWDVGKDRVTEGDVAAYLADAKIQEQGFVGMTEDIAGKFGGKYAYRLKSPESVMEKMARRPADFSLGKMNDTLGSTVITNDIDGAIRFAKENFDVTKVDDFRTRPTFLGYGGAHLDVELPNGQIGEIQINTLDGLYRKQDAHRTYDKWRKYIESAQGTSLSEIMSGIPAEKQVEFLADVERSRNTFRGAIPVRVESIMKTDSYVKEASK